MKKVGKYIICIVIDIIIKVLAIVLKNNSLKKIDLENDFVSISYTNESYSGGNISIILNANHEWVCTINNSEDNVTTKTLTDTEFREFKDALANSEIFKVPKSIGKEGNGPHEKIVISLMNEKNYEINGYGIDNQDFRKVVDAILKYNN